MDYQDRLDNPMSYLMKITADYFYIYNNLLIDTSFIRTFNFATIYNAYIPDTPWPQTLVGEREEHFTLTF